MSTEPAPVRFERQYRTPRSEGYHLLRQDHRIGHLDLHFTHRDVHASLVLLEDLAEDAVLDIVEQIDDSLVLSAEVPRDDLLITVYRGREVGFYTDDFLAERTTRRSAGAPENGSDGGDGRSAS